MPTRLGCGIAQSFAILLDVQHWGEIRRIHVRWHLQYVGLVTTLRSPRLRYQPASIVHRDALAQMSAGATVVPNAQSRVDTILQYSQLWFAQHGFGLWIISAMDADDPLGWVGLRPGEDPTSPELLYGLAPSAQGHGYATEASATILKWLFAQERFAGAWAATVRSNPASVRVLERLRMRCVGSVELDGVDSLVYRITKPEWIAAGAT